MKKTLETYKFNFVALTMVFGYASMHFFLNSTYDKVSFEKLASFDVIKPYANRVLIPTIVFLLKPLASIDTLFYLIELVMVYALYYVTLTLTKQFTSERQAKLGALFLLVFLSLVYVVNYRFPEGGAATFFFPYDTPALFFTMLGLKLAIDKNWGSLYLIMGIATLNRESSLLLALIVPALYAESETIWKRPFGLLLLIYLLMRAMITFFLQERSGSPVEFYSATSGFSHLAENIHFIIISKYFLFLLAELAFLPVLWLLVNAHIPKMFVRLRFVALLYILGLFIVGKIIEGRIWGEAVILLYFPMVLGAFNWINNKPTANSTELNTVQKIEKNAVPLITFTFAFISLTYILFAFS